jgi:NAD/NADP transhydrogenase alpha subunit
MKVPEAEEKVRETIIEIRKVLTNKKWCKWADAWLSGADRSVESAISIAEEMARRRAPAKTTAGRSSSRRPLLSLSAGNAALAAAIVARSTGELDQFAAMMLAEYVKGRGLPTASKEGERRH